MRRASPSVPSAVIGVLTPHTGGFYYGSVVNGILETVRRHKAVAVAFETSKLALLSETTVLGAQIVDGWLAVNEFHDPALLKALRARGMPIIHLHSKPDVAHGAVVLPDNRGGAQALTRHLIEHGHRRIAFAGNLSHIDIEERLEGYQAALSDAGLIAAPELVFDTPHHKELDGEELATELLRHGLVKAQGGRAPHERSSAITALVAATDRLAVGALDVFLRSGLNVPEDIALVGFDDADMAQFAEPPLTTVKQRFSEAAECAVTELLNAIAEGRPPRSLGRVPTQAVIRRSCGCPLPRSIAPPHSDTEAARVEALSAALLNFAARGRPDVVTCDEWPGARTIAELIDRSLTGTLGANVAAGKAWTGFLALRRDAESAVGVMDLLESTVRSWSSPVSRATRALLRELRVSLLHQWQRAERTKVEHYESVTEAAYRLARELSGTSKNPARDLRWIRWSNAHHASCSLWAEHLPRLAASPPLSPKPIPKESPPPSGTALYLTGEFPTGKDENALATAIGLPLSPEHFPPRKLIDVAARNGAIVSVAAIPRARGGDYGLLAVVAPLAFEHLEYIGTPGDWAIQLGGALDRTETEFELKESAELDALTGLANRATLLRCVEYLRTSVDAPPFALLFIDLDDFKKVNDSLGHEAGDLLLVQIAQRLTKQVEAASLSEPSSFNIVSRIGGDEFVIVLAGVADEASAESVVGRLQERLKQPYQIHGRSVFVSASIGVNFGHAAGASAPELLRDADTAMSRAKLRGRARHEIFHRGMHTEAVEKLHLDARLRLAIEQDELELWYQPIIDLQSGADVGAEALIRWRHPEEGLLSPARFLGVAEEVGLTLPLSQWVIRHACRQAALRPLVRGNPPYVNVNVPADHIKHPDFVDYVEACLRDNHIKPHTFGIEIVESTLLDEPERCTRALARLRALGIRIAIDDFGTGYSNLSYLRDLPVTTLKMDRSFVRNIPGNEQDNGIARAIIAMGHQLGLGLVAEGIETRAQYDFLRDSGCNCGQGYLMSVPLEHQAYLARFAAPEEAVGSWTTKGHASPSEWPTSPA